MPRHQDDTPSLDNSFHDHERAGYGMTREEKLTVAHDLGIADCRAGYPERSYFYRFPAGTLRDVYRAAFAAEAERAAAEREEVQS